MEQVCEILWKKNENGKNMTLIMCIEESLINKTNNSVFFNEINRNLSKFNKNTSLENKTIDEHLKNYTDNILINTTFINVNASVIPSVSPSIATPSKAPSIEPSIEPSVIPLLSPSPYYKTEDVEIVINEIDFLSPSSNVSNEEQNYTNKVDKINSDDTSLIALLISGGLIGILLIIYILKKYRNSFSVAPCPPVVITSKKKENYIKKANNNNKPKDYILEILPGTPRSALFNRVPVAKKASSTRRSRSLPRKTVRQVKLKRRVNSLPDLKKLDIERNRRKKDKLPPLPLHDEPPPIPIRTERIKRLVEIKMKMKKQKEKNSKLMAI